jgi:hypothetical protein
MKMRFYLYVDGNCFILNGMVGRRNAKYSISAFSIRRIMKNEVYCKSKRFEKLFKNEYEVGVMR